MTIRISLILTILLFHSSSFSQSKRGIWDKSEWRRANTARFSFYTDRRMRETIRYVNLSRINGKKFVQAYLDTSDHERFNRSLIKMLNRQDNMPVLRPSFSLYLSAKIHAIRSGFTGDWGHRYFDERVFITNPFGNIYSGENCDYGEKDPLSIALILLTDKGVESLGHRLNILNRNFGRIGCAHFWHSKWRTNVVMELSGPNSMDFLLGRPKLNRQFGAIVGISNISNRPLIDIGLANFAHDGTPCEMLITCNFSKGTFNNLNAASVGVSFGGKQFNSVNFFPGIKLQLANSYKKTFISIQPQISAYKIISFFRGRGIIWDSGDRESSAIWLITYGRDIPLLGERPGGLYRNSITFSRFMTFHRWKGWKKMMKKF